MMESNDDECWLGQLFLTAIYQRKRGVKSCPRWISPDRCGSDGVMYETETHPTCPLFSSCRSLGCRTWNAHSGASSPKRSKVSLPTSCLQAGAQIGGQLLAGNTDFRLATQRSNRVRLALDHIEPKMLRGVLRARTCDRILDTVPSQSFPPPLMSGDYPLYLPPAPFAYLVHLASLPNISKRSTDLQN